MLAVDIPMSGRRSRAGLRRPRPGAVCVQLAVERPPQSMATVLEPGASMLAGMPDLD